MARHQIEQGGNPDQKRIEAHKLNAMIGFAESLTCRRRVLLGYLGETRDADCGNCDICLDPPERFDATEAAQKVLSCVYRLRQSFGMKHVVDVLRGADTERIRNFRHDRLSTYGIGPERSHAEWMSLARQLIHRGYLRQDIAAYSVLKLTAAAARVLKGQEQVVLARPRIREAPQRKPAARVTAELGPADTALFEALRALRRRLALEAGVPPYVIFGDAALMQMSVERPANAGELLEINGVGQVKLERYGEVFLQAIAEQSALMGQRPVTR
jgi:ATP-dependent DNA helicase RecQ